MPCSPRCVHATILKRKPKSLWDRMINAFTGKGQTTTEAQEEPQNKDIDIEDEEDEDLLLFPEEFEDKEW